MKITTEPLEDRQLALTIEVDEEQAQQAMRRAARQFAKRVSIPGFRKGKAPYSLIVQRHGEDAIRKEAADLLAQEAYREALEQEGIKPEKLRELVASGRVVITGTARDNCRPIGIGDGLKTKVNANLGTSPDHANIEVELEKLRIAIEAGADTVMDLSTGGDIDE